MNSKLHTPGKLATFRRTALTLTMVLLALGAANPALATPPPPSSGVTFEKALANVRHVTDMHYGWNVYRVSGESMAPQFGNSSLLLVQAVKFEQLTPGMLVIYKDKDGDLVAHRLIEQTPAGWVAKGLNNDRTDPGLVNGDNLQGVVFGIFHYKTGTEKLAALSAADEPPVALAKKY